MSLTLSQATACAFGVVVILEESDFELARGGGQREIHRLMVPDADISPLGVRSRGRADIGITRPVAGAEAGGAGVARPVPRRVVEQGVRQDTHAVAHALRITMGFRQIVGLDHGCPVAHTRLEIITEREDGRAALLERHLDIVPGHGLRAACLSCCSRRNSTFPVAVVMVYVLTKCCQTPFFEVSRVDPFWVASQKLLRIS